MGVCGSSETLGGRRKLASLMPAHGSIELNRCANIVQGIVGIFLAKLHIEILAKRTELEIARWREGLVLFEQPESFLLRAKRHVSRGTEHLLAAIPCVDERTVKSLRIVPCKLSNLVTAARA